jgi:hypothetical protein
MLVEADDAEQAFRIVADKLNGDELHPDWSDWSEVGDPTTLNFAGRWAGEIFMTPEQLKARSEKQDVDVSENPNYLRFSDDPNLADEVIQRFISYRMNEIESIKKTISLLPITFDLMTYDYNPYKVAEGMTTYYANKLVSIYNDTWTSDTAIYDLHSWDANLKYFFERVAKNPERQFLIPVDFHC